MVDQTNDPDQVARDIATMVRARNGSLEPVYAAITSELEQIEKGGVPLEALYPDGAEQGFLGRKRKDGETFLHAYAVVISENICSQNAKLRKALESGLTATGTGLTTTVMIALGLPAVAVGVAAAIAGALAALGLEAFCAATEPKNGAR